MGSKSDKLVIFDTTLRDGEQSPGASMNVSEKLRIAKILEKLNVDVIEAGFPIASKGDFDAVFNISSNIKNSTIFYVRGYIKYCIKVSFASNRETGFYNINIKLF